MKSRTLQGRSALVKLITEPQLHLVAESLVDPRDRSSPGYAPLRRMTMKTKEPVTNLLLRAIRTRSQGNSRLRFVAELMTGH